MSLTDELGGLTVEDGFDHPSRPGERTARPEHDVTTVRRGGSGCRSLGAARGNFRSAAFRLNDSAKQRGLFGPAS